MVGEEGAFVLGWDEVLTEEELSVTLKVKMARLGEELQKGAQSAAGQISSAEWLSEGDKHLKAVRHSQSCVKSGRGCGRPAPRCC